jgi:hypothetical protein
MCSNFNNHPLTKLRDFPIFSNWKARVLAVRRLFCLDGPAGNIKILHFAASAVLLQSHSNPAAGSRLRVKEKHRNGSNICNDHVHPAS